MSFETTIAWTGTPRADGSIEPGSSWSPWEGCAHRSLGCLHCYAERDNHRWGKSNWGYASDGRRQPLLERSENHWKQPLIWNRKAARDGVRRKVFPSVCDPFDEAAPHHLFVRFINLIDSTPALDWLLLTKCPQNILERLASLGREGLPANVWIGTSVENQAVYHARLSALLQIPARVRFLSCEPLIGPVDLALDAWFKPDGGVPNPETDKRVRELLHWVICGGESGHGARGMKPEWVDSLIAQNKYNGIPVFMKQTGTVLAREMGLKHSKGEDLFELPERWQIQEFPK